MNAQTADTPPRSAVAASPGRILVVDDTPANVKLLEDLLTFHGYDVEAASNGEEALVAIRERTPDLILLDVMMPGITGYEVCQAIRADPPYAMLPVVMVTALEDRDERVKGIEAGADDPLESHRREITVLFLDLRGFTSFAEASEPEEVMRAISEFHRAMGRRIIEYQATLERFTGDGLMVFFNDPLPILEPARRAVEMAFAMQEDALALSAQWKKRGYDLGLGVGIAQGYATVGAIGFEGRIDYGAIGHVTNLASRLCDLAVSGDILVSQRVHMEVEERVYAEDLGEVKLHGFARPVRALKLLDYKGAA